MWEAGREDLGCVEADAVPARGGRLRLGLVEEGDCAVAEPREVQRLPPPSIISTIDRNQSQSKAFSFPETKRPVIRSDFKHQ